MYQFLEVKLSYIWLFFISLIQFGFFYYMSINRLVAGDEGFYLIAGQLVLDGKTPYLDFFYPQMPLYPYVLAGWFRIFGEGWQSARLLACLCSTGCGTLVYLITKMMFHNHQKQIALSSLATFLFAGSHLSFAWLTINKSYCLCLFLLLASIYLQFKAVNTANHRKKNLLLFLTGLFLSLSINTRLYLAALLTVQPLSIFLHNWKTEKKEPKTQLLLFLPYLAGILSGGLGTLLLLALSPSNFLFNNLTYHLNRSKAPLVKVLKFKAQIAGILFGVRPTRQFFGFDFLCLAAGGILASLLLLIPTKIAEKNVYKTGLIGDIIVYGLTIFVVSWIPTPAYIQYFCLAVPFLAISSAWFISRLPSITQSIATLTLLACFSFHLPKNIKLYSENGIGTIGINSQAAADAMRIPFLESVTNELNNLTPSRDKTYSVLSLWPGYLVGAKQSLFHYPGSENHFSYRIAHKLTEDKRRQYHLLSRFEFREVISQSQPDLIVLNNKSARKKFAPFLKTGRYQTVSEIGSLTILSNRTQSPESNPSAHSDQPARTSTSINPSVSSGQ